MSLREVERVEGIFIRILLLIKTIFFWQIKNFVSVAKASGVAIGRGWPDHRFFFISKNFLPSLFLKCLGKMNPYLTAISSGGQPLTLQK